MDEMQDDVDLVTAAGWTDAARPREIAETRTKIRETPDFAVGRRKYKMDLIPPVLVAARCFAAEQAEAEKLRAEREAAAGALDAFLEEHTGADGALADPRRADRARPAGVRPRLSHPRPRHQGATPPQLVPHCRTNCPPPASGDRTAPNRSSRGRRARPCYTARRCAAPPPRKPMPSASSPTAEPETFGFAAAGFRFRVMAELEPSRLDVALRNHAGAVGVPGDLTKTWRKVVDRWRETRPDTVPSLLAACPPCQGMSTARSGRGAEDDPDADGSRNSRNLLVLPIARIAGELETLGGRAHSGGHDEERGVSQTVTRLDPHRGGNSDGGTDNRVGRF